MKTDPFQQVIEEYLKDYATKDLLFAKAFENPEKNIKDCCTYIINEVKKKKVQGLPSSVVYGMAVHYYDEKDIKVGSPVSCRVVIDKEIELTPEEIKEAKEKGLAKAKQEALDKIAKEAAKDIMITDEEKSEIEEIAKQQALDKAISDQKEKLAKKAIKKKETSKAEVQSSLFD